MGKIKKILNWIAIGVFENSLFLTVFQSLSPLFVT